LLAFPGQWPTQAWFWLVWEHSLADGLNRLNGLAFNGQKPGFTFGYDALSRRTSLTRPNGVTTTYAYDAASSLTSVLHKQGTTVLDGATYLYDAAENRTQRTDKRTNVTLKYGYDNIYQRLTAKQGTTVKESYTYDLVGNRHQGRVEIESEWTARRRERAAGRVCPPVELPHSSQRQA